MTPVRPIFRPVLQVAVAGAVASLALLAYAAYRINAQGDLDERRPADAIVVLGAAQFDGRPGDVFTARLDHAVALWKDSVAPYLVVTGGKLPGDRTTEAGAARAWAIAHGVPAESILSEDQGRTTLESLQAVRSMFLDRNLRSAVFVSDRTHMLRVLRMAADQGIEGWGSPTTTSPSDLDGGRRQRAMLHEMAGLAAYYVGGVLGDDRALSSAPERRGRTKSGRSGDRRVFPSWRGQNRPLYSGKPPAICPTPPRRIALEAALSVANRIATAAEVRDS